MVYEQALLSWVSSIAALHCTQVKSAQRVDVWTLLSAVAQTRLFKKLRGGRHGVFCKKFPTPCALQYNLLLRPCFCWLVWAVWAGAAAGAWEQDLTLLLLAEVGILAAGGTLVPR
jgi:hypothetical protein